MSGSTTPPPFPAGPQLIDGALLNTFFAAFTSGGGHTTTPAAGLTATPGGAQIGATLLSASINLVNTVATAGDSVALPPAIGGQVLFVANGSTTNAIAVWVQPNDNMNGVRNASLSVPAAKNAVFFSPRLGGWRSMLSA